MHITRTCICHGNEDSNEESIENVLLEIPNNIAIADSIWLCVNSKLAQCYAKSLRVAFNHLDEIKSKWKQIVASKKLLKGHSQMTSLKLNERLDLEIVDLTGSQQHGSKRVEAWKTFSEDFSGPVKVTYSSLRTKKILLAKFCRSGIRFLGCYWDFWVLDFPCGNLLLSI